MEYSAADLVSMSRSGAGLSQRALAKKAHTAQSVVARVEQGETSPTWDTLVRLIRGCGFRLVSTLERVPTVDRSILDDVPRILRMTPQQRLEEVAHVSRFVASAKRV
jgi:ribosome-binding protein aMBF1 (putative translation factor)